MKPRINKFRHLPNLFTFCLGLTFAGLHAVQAQTTITFANPAAITQTASSTSGSPTITMIDGTKYAVGDIIRFTNVTESPFGVQRFCYVVNVSGNDISVSDTPGGTALDATSTTTAAETVLSLSISEDANYTGGLAPDSNSEIANFSSPTNGIPAFITTSAQTLYGLTQFGSGSDLLLASGGNGTGLHPLTFATNDASTPRISGNSGTRIIRLGSTGTFTAPLATEGSQGLIFEGLNAGAITGTGTDATSANPGKNIRVNNVDWSGFSGGVTLERGEVNFQNALGNIPTDQALTVGNAQTTSNNTLTHLAMNGFGATVDGLNGTSLGRISGNSTLTVGNSNGSGDYAGVIGRGMTATETNTSLVKNGGGTQAISGIIVGGGSVDANGGTLVLSGNNTFTGGIVSIDAGATLQVGNVNGLGTGTIGGSATLQGTLDVNGFAITNSIADKAIFNGTITNTGAAVDLTGMGNIGATAGRVMNLDGTGDMTFGQQITVGYSVVKNGSNTVILAGANTYGGTTTVNNGTLQLGDGGITGSLNPNTTITNDSSLTFNRSVVDPVADRLTQSTGISNSAISGTGSITQKGPGATILDVTNTYTGGTTIEDGVLSYGADGAFGTGDLTINGGRIGIGAASLTLANNIIAGGNFAIGSESGLSGNASGITVSGGIDLGGATREITIRRTTTLAGAISNGGLTFIGVGGGDSPDAGRDLFMDGENAYTDDTTVTSGILTLTGTGVLRFVPTTNGASNKITGTGTLNLNGTIFLDLSGADTTAGNSWLIVDVANLTESYTGLAVNSSLGAFSNSSGTWTFDDGTNLWTFEETTGTLSVASASTPFQDWMVQFTTLSGDDLLPGADPDFDNVDNFTEFAFDGNPEDGSNNGQIHLYTEDTVPTAKLVLTVAVRDDTDSPWSGAGPMTASSTTDGIDYTIEGSIDLSDFSDAVSEVTPVQNAGLGSPSAGYKWQSFQLDSSVGLAGKGFLRAGAGQIPE